MSKLSQDKNIRKSVNSKNLEPSKSDISCSQNGGDLDVDHGTACFVCKKTVSTKDKALQCDCCNYWHHISCEEVSAQTYKTLVGIKESGVKWYCRKCDVGVHGILRQIVILNANQKETNDRLSYVETKLYDVESLEERLKQVESRLEEFVKNPPPSQPCSSKPKSFAEAVALDKKDIEEIVELRTKEKLKEVEDKARRQKNVIIFRLDESSDETKEEKDMEDKVSVERILREIKMDNVKPTNMFRLKGNALHRDRARPLKVCFRSQIIRDDFLKAFSDFRKRSKSSDDSLSSKVSIRKDLTREERIADDKLFKEMKAKQEQSKNLGDEFAKWIRRGGKVVNIGIYPESESEREEDE